MEKIDKRIDVLVCLLVREYLQKVPRMDLGSQPKWTVDEYCQKSAGLMDVKRFGAMAVDSKSLIIHDRVCFERDTTLGAWKRQWGLLTDGMYEYS